jgi:hypothetical protein
MSNILNPEIRQPIEGGQAFLDMQQSSSNLRFLYEKSLGQPYVFLKDFSFIHGKSDGSIGSAMVNFKKDQVVYPFPSQPNVRFVLDPAFEEAIKKGVLIKKSNAQLNDSQKKLLEESIITEYSGITDKIFGRSKGGWGLDPQRLRLGTYIILGAVVGRYVAKSMKKSTTLGVVVGGLAPLLAYQLSLEYDRKNMPKQEPKQPVKAQTNCIMPPCPQ